MNRLHPFSAVTTTLNRGIVGLSVPFFLIGVLSSVTDAVDPVWSIYLAPIGLVAGVAYGLTYYYRFEYALTQDTFDLSSGVFSRRSREIPFRRIQNVDVRQGLVQQLLGVAVVTIETAGGGDTEAQLNFVSEDEANRLQREIRRLTAAANGERSATEAETASSDEDEDEEATSNETADLETAATPERHSDPGVSEDERHEQPVDHGEPTRLFELSSRELGLYSFTSFSFAAVGGVLFLLLFANDAIFGLLISMAEPLGGPANLDSASPLEYGVFGIISLVNGLALTYLFSVVYTFLGYYGFQVGRAGEDLVYERGLLQRYSGSIPLEKVQSLTVSDNPLQRQIGYAGLWIETAGYGPDSGGGSQSAIPLARKRRVYGFAERLSGLERPSFRRPTTVARRRYLGRYSIIAGVVVAGAFGLSLVTAVENWWLAAVVFLAVPPAAHLRWVNLGYYVGEDNLVIRSGFWKRRTTVVPYYRLQTVSTRRSIFQRRLGLASLVVDTASSRTFFWATPTIYDLEYEVAREINETTRQRLQSALRERARSSDSEDGDAGVSVAFT
ncbi:PH domain-containing protein [Halobacteria archaeon AArc-m2/3/4]|uniref:PH domain-containing protein n=1 Tax=Natronoglomus mannanivorans TaxID=2979990 RepID=A0AAP2YX18_9EURY|nr:PH domain-containing protein [Halobacteria archaeon AArc-xg1-1]MCU4971376.1 PH domain-containing protein [Halobacteria archaeon AArc-m2/3/4]